MIKINEGMFEIDRKTNTQKALEVGSYYIIETNSDLEAIVRIMDTLQLYAQSSSHILFKYSWILDKVRGYKKTP